MRTVLAFSLLVTFALIAPSAAADGLTWNDDGTIDGKACIDNAQAITERLQIVSLLCVDKDGSTVRIGIFRKGDGNCDVQWIITMP